MKVYAVFFYDDVKDVETLSAIFRSEKEAMLYAVLSEFEEDLVFSGSGYVVKEIKVEKYEPDWDGFLEDLKWHVEEYGAGKRLKESLNLIMEYMPEEVKRRVIELLV